jgi:DNA-binding NarL/FixJ family response regulator
MNNLIIYEDNARLRHSLEILLNDGDYFRVVGAFEHCDDALEQVAMLNAELILMDIDMPGIGGMAGVKLVKNTFPEVKILIHTVFDDDARIFDCICNGADGYLLKNTSPLKLIQSLQDVMKGDVPMSPFVAQKVFQFFRSKPVAKDEFNLTRREKEILEFLVKGNSYKMIAGQTGISVDTVRKHLQNIYHKLHVNCGTEAVTMAIRHKIVKLD